MKHVHAFISANQARFPYKVALEVERLQPGPDQQPRGPVTDRLSLRQMQQKKITLYKQFNQTRSSKQTALRKGVPTAKNYGQLGAVNKP